MADERHIRRVNQPIKQPIRAQSPLIPGNLTLQQAIRSLKRSPIAPDTGWLYVTPIAPASATPDYNAADPLYPTWDGSWGNAGGAYLPMSFYLSEEGRVFFRGHPVGGVPGTRAFVLPVGYRPPGSHTFIVPNDLAGYTVIRVDPNGDVIVVRSTAS